jgi:hypothetical protein
VPASLVGDWSVGRGQKARPVDLFFGVDWLAALVGVACCMGQENCVLGSFVAVTNGDFCFVVHKCTVERDVRTRGCWGPEKAVVRLV